MGLYFDFFAYFVIIFQINGVNMKKSYSYILFSLMSVMSVGSFAQTKSYFENLCEMPRPCDECQPSGFVWDVKCKDPSILNRNFDANKSNGISTSDYEGSGAAYNYNMPQDLIKRQAANVQNTQRLTGNSTAMSYPAGIDANQIAGSMAGINKEDKNNFVGNSDYAKYGQSSGYSGGSVSGSGGGSSFVNYGANSYANTSSGYASGGASNFTQNTVNSYAGSVANQMGIKAFMSDGKQDDEIAPGGGKYNSSVSNPFALCSAPRPCDKCQPLRSLWDDVCPAGQPTAAQKQNSNAAMAELGMGGLTADMYRAEMEKINQSRQALISESGSELNAFMNWKSKQPSPSGVGTVGDDWKKLRANSMNQEDQGAAIEQQIKKQSMMEIEMANSKNEQVLGTGYVPPKKPWE